MHIGVTYDLKEDYLRQGLSEEQVAEFDRVETIDAIKGVLERMGHQVTLIGSAPSLIERLADKQRWDLVFNIAEGARGTARESQVPAILDVVGIGYTFSDPLVLAICLDKRLAKHVLSEHAIASPRFWVVQAWEKLSEQTWEFPLFAKPIAEGTSRGITAASKINSLQQLEEVCRELLDLHKQPVLIEEYLPGREFTVGIVGTGREARSLGALEIQLHGADSEVYSYDNKQYFEDRVSYQLADDDEARAAVELALAAYRVLGCRDGGRIDVRFDRHGAPAFIEANPLAGLNPDISDIAILARLAGTPYDHVVQAIVESAIERLQLNSEVNLC